MFLKQKLGEKKASIVKAWTASIEAAPGSASADFREKQIILLDALGCTLAQGVEGLFDALLQGVIPDNVSRFLDGMIRIRAANDFKASEAVAFIFELKKIVREELGKTVQDDPGLKDELTAWDAVVDDLVLFAFENYAQHKERILEARAKEATNETLRLLKKAGLMNDDQ